MASSLNQGCQEAIESFHRRHDNVVSEMEGLKDHLEALTNKVSSLETLLRQVLDRLATQQPPNPPPLPQEEPTSEDEDEEAEAPSPPPSPAPTVAQLNHTPRQPAIGPRDRFPKTWSQLLRMWRADNWDEFLTTDQRSWPNPVIQAYKKRRYCVEYLRDRCRTAPGVTQERREDAAAAALDRELGDGTLCNRMKAIHREDPAIARRRGKRRRMNDYEDDDEPQQQQQPAPRQRQQQARRGRGRVNTQGGVIMMMQAAANAPPVQDIGRSRWNHRPVAPPILQRMGAGNPFGQYACHPPSGVPPMVGRHGNRGQGARMVEAIATEDAERRRNLHNAELRRRLPTQASILLEQNITRFI